MLRLLLPALLLVAACGGGASPGDRPVSVVAGFYPLQLLAERIGGDRVAVTTLAAPGAEPHELELTPRQVAAIGDADLVLRLDAFQPAVDDAVEQEAADADLDLSVVEPLVDGDPHVWLDPARYARLAGVVSDRLAQLDPEGAAGYRARSDALQSELTELDAAMRTGLATCARDDLVTSHDAFGYLARAYGLEQVAVTGLVPEEEASPSRLAEVADLARARGVTTIFFETLVSPRVAQSLAREVGAATAVLDPLEGPPAEGDYLAAQRANLAVLRTALGCS